MYEGKSKNICSLIIVINETTVDDSWSSIAQTFACLQRKMFLVTLQATYALLPSTHGH
jgi:hypothetical protein